MAKWMGFYKLEEREKMGKEFISRKLALKT
jgi:hypothetical protein